MKQTEALHPGFESFRKKIADPIRFRFFMLRHLPTAFFAGLRMASLNEKRADIKVRFSWFNQNPFRSIYFAVLAMAAEMSTGILAFGQTYQRSVSMLVVGMEAKFYKKAVGTIQFTCIEGEAIARAVDVAIRTGEGQTIQCHAIGKNGEGEIVAEFWFTWSFKKKN